MSGAIFHGNCYQKRPGFREVRDGVDHADLLLRQGIVPCVLEQVGVGADMARARVRSTLHLLGLRRRLILRADPPVRHVPAEENGSYPGLPVVVGGRDPRKFASAELGREIIKIQTERMAKILRQALGGTGQINQSNIFPP
ncbi:MAG: hypothetical protein JW837_03125 [Sedimentisphaerales bacterium]|nr:hypothetical protein [Sedimentisphaerales bacterium]